jgi:hypothetical protein
VVTPCATKLAKFSLKDGYFEKKAETEGDISMQFAHAVMSTGAYSVHMEVPLPSRHHRSKMFRADCLVTKKDEKGDRVVLAVEFKRPSKKTPGPQSRQSLAYQDLGLPWVFCVGRPGIEKALLFLPEFRA